MILELKLVFRGEIAVGCVMLQACLSFILGHGRSEILAVAVLFFRDRLCNIDEVDTSVINSVTAGSEKKM